MSAGALVTAEGTIRLPAGSVPLARGLASMPCFRSAKGRTRAALAPLLERGIVGPQDLPLRIIPSDPAALDGWRFS
jgi:hypothetical protein